MALVLFDNSKLFRDIAQTKSVSRGAAQNGISQSAASQHIQELERKLGMPLLDRATRPLALTAAGRLYFDLCRDVLRREEEFQAALDEFKAQVEGAVRVASIYSIGLSEMSRLQEEFSRRFPNAQLHVDYLRPQKIYESMLAQLFRISWPRIERSKHEYLSDGSKHYYNVRCPGSYNCRGNSYH